MTVADERPALLRRFWRVVILGGVLLIGGALSAISFVEAQKADDLQVRGALELRAEWRARDFEDKIDNALGGVAGIKNFVGSQDEIDADGFQAFATQTGQGLPVARLDWAPIVRAKDRAAFERETGPKLETPGFTILDMNEKGALTKAGDRDLYAPNQYEQRFKKLGSLLGYDQFADPGRRAAAQRASDQGKPATALMAMPGDQGVMRRFVVFWPVYVRPVVPETLALRRAQIAGFAIGTFEVTDLFGYAIAHTPAILETLSLVDGDQADPTSIPLARYNPAEAQISEDGAAIGEPAAGGLRLVRSFETFGRTWTLVSDFSPQMLSELRSPAPWGYGALCIVLTLVLAGYLILQQRRQTAIEATVVERTQELHRTTEELQAIFDSSPLATGSADIDGRITSWNPSAEQIFGYSAAEVLGERNVLTRPGDRQGVAALFERLKQGEVVRGVTLPLRTKSGAIVEGSVSAAGFRDAEGNIRGVIFTVDDVTERRRAEKELRRNQDHLTRVQRVARIGSTEVDLVTGEVIWSDEIYRLIGRGTTSIEPGVDSFANAIHPDDRERIREASLRGRNGEDVPPTEFRVFGADGAVKWFYRQTDFLRDPSGKPTKLITTMYDITPRKEAEAALLRSEEHLSRAQQIGNWGSIDTDLRTMQSQWSDQLFRILGIESNGHDTNFDSFIQSVHPDDRAMVREYRTRAYEQQDDHEYECRIVRQNGEIRWLHRIADMIYDADGRPERLITTFHDITARKEAEAARVKMEEQYHLTFDMAPVGIAHVALDGRFILVNRTLCALVGYDAPELMTMSYRSVTHPDDDGESEGHMQRMLDGSVTVATWEKRYVRKDGSTVWLQLTSTVTRDEQDRPGHFITVYSDISAIREGAARRAELESQLQQSQKMEAVGRLTGGVAHDFNNLLTVVLGNLELMREEIGADRRLAQRINDAMMAGKRGADLTHRLLAFSRRQPLEPVVVDINKRIGELLPLLRRTLGESISIRPRLDISLWRVIIDPGQLESAILNLAVNSRDAMPAGGDLEIMTENVGVDEAYAATRPGLALGNYVRISVSDSGSGMPADVLAQAFEPFFTTKEVGKGTGLGLSMVYGFVKQSGGHASIYSEVGHGTTVTLLLPAAIGAGQEAVPGKGAAELRGAETILLVEDDPAVRTVTVSFLEALGYRVIDAGTAADGYDAFVAHPSVSLILTDVILPGGADGAGLARRARALRPGIKVLFMSGYTEDVVMHNGRLDPGVILLRKPFTRGQLAEKVRAAIDGVPAG